MSKVKIRYDDKILRNRTRNFKRDFRHAVSATVDRHALETTTWLKTNARWTDRTGAARSGLQAIPHHAQTYEEILMTYSVDYGIWLEIAHDRKYAIITPGMRIMGESLMRNFDRLIDRMYGL